MNTTQSHPALSRRDLIKLLAIAGVTATGGYILFEVAPWLNYDQQATQTWRPLEKVSPLSAQMRELVRSASLAASGHNTQPWKFALKDSAIEIHPDFARRLPVVDPNDRELWISLGCALENLLDFAEHQIGVSQSAHRSSRCARAVSECHGVGHCPAAVVGVLGYAEAMPRSLRRPVEQVLV